MSVENTGRENKAIFVRAKQIFKFFSNKKVSFYFSFVYVLHFGWVQTWKKKPKQNWKPYKKNPNPEYSNMKIRAFGHLSSCLLPHCYCDTKTFFFHGLNGRENIFQEKLWKVSLWLLLWSGTCRVLTRNFSLKQPLVTAPQLLSILQYS